LLEAARENYLHFDTHLINDLRSRDCENGGSFHEQLVARGHKEGETGGTVSVEINYLEAIDGMNKQIAHMMTEKLSQME
jgi:hypothetical protein